jgi:predicted DNA-binding transcriptional regulator YafY
MAKPRTAKVHERVRDARLHRVQLILRLLAQAPLPVEVLTERLSVELASCGLPPISARSVNDDIAWLRQRFGGGGVEQVKRSALATAQPAAFRTYRSFYRLVPGDGLVPVRGDGLLALTEVEVLALTTARAMIARAPARDGKHGESGGPLAEALERILDRLGVRDPELLPDFVDVQQTSQQVWDAEVLRTLMRAIRSKSGVRGMYQALSGPPHEVHLNPVRLMLNYDEWHLWAWNGGDRPVRNYKVARFSTLALAERLAGQPASAESMARRNALEGFEGYAGDRLERVMVRFTAEATHKVLGRCLGLDQEVEHLPDGGLRITFSTRGGEALKPWVRAFGSQAIWEKPPA